MLGYTSGGDWYSDSFATKAESLPGCFIIQREINKAVSGEDFFYNDKETGKPIRCKAVNYEKEFIYYYRIWENFHYFGLPHGAGWIEERQWLLDFLKVFERANKDVEFFVEMRARKKAGAGA